MSAESLNIFEETAPTSSIRKAANGDESLAAIASAPATELRGASPPTSPPTPADYAVGKILAGKYRVERKVGEGAMGVVLAATHIGLDEPVAIKFIRPEVQHVEGALARFAKEAKIAARIRSEHVTKVLDVGVLDPIGPYIVMEYLEGKSLADLLDARLFERRGPMPPERVVEYLLQACEALAAAHAIGVVHRDVKPDNLFVTRHAGLEVVKLLDFGISKAALTGRALGDDVAATTSFVMGTPLYMSPEQLRSSPDVDCRTDIWSMGAVMYELLCGKPPFHGGSMPEICAAILEAAPVPLQPTCPAELRAVVMRCLEKDRERRFQTVADLATALIPFAPGEARAYASRSSCILRASSLDLDVARGAESAAATPASERAPRPARFQSSALVAAATVLALSALGVAITFSKKTAEPAPPPAVARPSGESSGDARAAQPARAIEAQAPQRAVDALAAYPTGEPSYEWSVEPAPPLESVPAEPTASAASPVLGAAPAPSEGLLVAPERAPEPAPSRKSKVARAPGARSGAPSPATPAGAAASIPGGGPAGDGAAGRSRVRLVEPRSRPRLVDAAGRDKVGRRQP